MKTEATAMSARRFDPVREKHKVEEWNRQHAVGTRVTVTKDDGSREEDVTMAPASLLGGHSAVVWLQGLGSYRLDRCAPLAEPADQAVTPAKKTITRTVFGRMEALIEGKTIRFEMRRDGIHVRRKRSRKERVISFMDAWNVSQGQGLLKL